MRGARISVLSIPVLDQDRAKQFYAGVLGFQVIMDNPFGEGMRWVMLRPPGGGPAITLVTWFPEMRPGSVHGTVLSVPDIAQAVAEMGRRGLAVDAAKIEEAPWGRWVTIEDPDGNRWVVQEDRPLQD